MKYLQPPTSFASAVLMLLVVLAPCHVARAGDNLYVGPDNGAWNVSANWSSTEPPWGPAPFFEAGVIGNNATVVLSEHTKSADPIGSPKIDIDVAGLRLGTVAAQSGGLRVTNGGVLPIINPGGGGETGAIQVGVNATGTGTLTVLGGGTVTGVSLSSGGATGSSITLGDTSGLTATLTLSGAATLGRTTTVVGPNVNFSAGGNLSLSGSSILVPDIRNSTTHSRLVTQGTASVGGTLKPMFTGVTPAAGNKWTLIDAPTTINGTFSTIDTSMAPALPAGQTYSVFQETIGGRRLLQLAVDEILVLQVNRTTGAVSIANIGTQPKSLDGYSILSSNGSLRTGTWDSLEGRVAGWVEAGPDADSLSELYPNLPAPGFSTVAAGGTLTLGTPYEVTVPALGTDPDDLTFEYNSPTRGTVQGLVQYTGTKSLNNFVLTVDSMGNAQLKLDSPLNTAIDGYSIFSDSGSLTPATWNSLQDQSISGWEQAPPMPTANAVAELKADGTLEFQNNTGFALGQLFKTVGATQDLRLEFYMPGQSVPGMGTVVYGPITPVPQPSAGVPGDFNDDGKVDAADYVVWRKHDRTPDGYTTWRSNFGRTSGSGSSIGAGQAAVPEPGTAALLVFVAIALAASRCVKR